MHVDADKLVANTTLTVYSRISDIIQPILIGIIAYFLVGVLNDVRELQDEAPAVKERVAILETNQQRIREGTTDFQKDIKAQLDQIQTLIRVQIQGQAALTATVNAQQKQIDQLLNEKNR